MVTGGCPGGGGYEAGHRRDWRAGTGGGQHVGVVAPGSDVPPHLTAVWRQADELRARGDVPAAIAALEPAAEVASMAFGADSPAALQTLHRLAVLYRLRGDLAAARRVLDEAQAGGARGFDDDDPLMLAIAGELGAVAEELGNRHEARRNWSKVAQYGPEVLGREHPKVRAAEAYLQNDPAGPVYVPPERLVLEQPTLTGLHTITPGRYPTTPAEQSAPAERTEPAEPVSPAPPPLVPPHAGSGGHSALIHPTTPVVHAVEQGVWRVSPASPQPLHFPPSAPGTAGGEPRRRGGRVALIVCGVLVLLVAAVLVGGLLQWRADDSNGGAQPGTGQSSAPAGPVITGGPTGEATLPRHGPATGVQLRDNGDHATLTWGDPSNGTVPFIVSGGRAGQEQRIYATLPAGSSSYPVSALNVNFDYCFVVIAVYSTSDLVTSDLVCTHRHLSPSPGG